MIKEKVIIISNPSGSLLAERMKEMQAACLKKFIQHVSPETEMQPFQEEFLKKCTGPKRLFLQPAMKRGKTKIIKEIEKQLKELIDNDGNK